MFNKLFAVCLLVNDFEHSLTFYRDIIGLEVNSTNDEFEDFKLAGTSLAIFSRKTAITMFPAKHMGKAGGAVYGFQVADVPEICKILKTKGVEIFEGPKTTEWGQTVAYFKDPDDNIWEISKL